MTSAAIANLPDDLWSHVIPFVELASLPNLQSLSKRFQKIFSSEPVYRIYAELKFSQDTLHVQRDYEGSWEALLQDDNGKGGVYVLRTLDIGAWKHNNDLLFYMNAVRYFVWDRSQQRVTVVVEAFGMTDLRSAHPSAFLCHSQGSLPGAHTSPWPYTSQKNLVDKPTYKLHAFAFTEESFAINAEDGCEFIYACIPGPFLRRKDYETIDLTPHFSTKSLAKSFSLEKDNCTFEARGSRFVKASNPDAWPIAIPEHCLYLKERGQWGSSELTDEENHFNILGGFWL